MHNPAVRWLPLALLALALIIPSGCYVYPVGGVVRTETVVREAPVPVAVSASVEAPAPVVEAPPVVVDAPPVVVAPPVIAAPVVESEVIYIDEYHHHPPHNYIYYPGEEVYYDPISISFFWSEGGHWRSGRRLPSHIRLHEEHRVSFRSDAAHPYDVHTRISNRYHAPAIRDARRSVESQRPVAPTRSFSPAMTPSAPARSTAPDRLASPSLRTPSRVAPASPAVSPSVRSQVAPARVSTPTKRDPLTPSGVATPSLRGTAPVVTPSVRSQVAPARVSTPAVRAQAAPARASVAPPRASTATERKRDEGRVIAQ